MLNSNHVLEVGLGFCASKVVMIATKLDLFTLLSEQPLSAQEICSKLQLHPRAINDFLDCLVALKFLERKDGQYKNTAETEHYLVRHKPTYVGGMLEMANDRLYGFWGNLDELLKTGEPQSEIKHGGDFFKTVYSDQNKLKQFLESMTGLSYDAIIAITQKFDWNKYTSFCDLGTAQGTLPVELVKAYPHLSGSGFDLPLVAPVFHEYVAKQKLKNKINFYPGDLFSSDLPKAEVYIMGHILHGWNIATKIELIKKCYDALPQGGVLIVFDSMIDDQRRENVYGFLMSLTLMIETLEGHDYTGGECQQWFKKVGFQNMSQTHLAGFVSMVIGHKP